MAQIKKPTVKNPELVDAMVAFKANMNKSTEKAMIEAVKNAKLIAPVIMDDLPDDLEPGQEYQANAKFMMVQQKNGKRFFPAFTEWLELLKWKNDPDCKTVTLSFDQYCALILRQNGEASGFVINPTEHNMVFTKEKLAEIKGVPVSQVEKPVLDASSALFGSNQVANPELTKAIAAFKAEQSPENEQIMSEQIRNARYVAPVLMEDLDKNINLKDGKSHQAQVKFIMIQREVKDSEKKEVHKFFPLFTNLEELKKWKNIPDCKSIVLTFDQYAHMMQQQQNEAIGLVIDPFGESMTIPKQMVATLQNHIEVQELDTLPLDLMNALKEHFETVPEIRAAYINGLRANGKDSYLLIIDCDVQNDMRPLFDPIANIANPYSNNVPNGIVPLASPIGKQATEGKVPFYKKEEASN